MATGDKKLIQITGRVIERKTKQGLSNLRVEAWDKDLIVKNAIGSATTDQQGAFVIELAKSQFKDLFGDRHVLLFFKVFQDNQLIISTEGSVLWDRDAQDSEIVIKVTIDTPTPVDTGQTFTVNGQVRRADGSAFKDGLVQAFITIQGQDRMLGETKTDPNGQFEIPYTLSDSQVSQIANVRIVVRVFDSQRIQLAESPAFIPDTTVTVNLTVPKPLPPPDETLSLRGRIRNKDGNPVAGAIVRAFITSSEKEIPIGEARTDSTGNYVITATVQSLATQPAGALLEARVFDSKTTLLGTSSSPIQKGATTMNVVVEMPGEEQCVVSGQIFQQDGKPLGSGIVRVYGAFPTQRALDKAAATITAVDDGRFRIEYQPAEFSPRISESNRVEVRVFRVVDNKEQELVQSPSTPVQFRADAEQSLNIKLRDNFDGPPVPAKTFTVEGYVRKGGLPLGNATVKAFDGSSASPFRTVQSSSDSNNLGHYVITYLVGPSPSDFTSAPHLVIRAYEGSVVGESVLGRPAGEHETMDVIIPVSPPPGDFFVEGHVVSGAQPVEGVLVQAIDWEITGRTVLGTQTTHADGSFHLSYHPAAGSVKQHLDMLIRVFTRDANNETDLLIPPLFIRDANPHLTLDNIDIPGLIAGPSEYEVITSKVMLAFPGLNPADLTDDGVELVARTTDLDLQLLAFYAAAAALARRTAIIPEAHYAFLTEGLPGNVTALLSQDPLVLRGALQQALDANIIPQRLRSQIDAIIDQVQQAIIAEAFRAGDTGLASLASLLATVITSPDRQREFVTLYLAHTGTIEQFWNSLRSNNHFGDNVVNDLQFAIQAGALTGNHIPLVRKLQQMRAANPPQIASLRDLAKKTQLDWETIIRQSGTPLTFPPGVAGNNENERVTNYAQTLSTIVADAFPTAVVSARFANDTGLNVPNKADAVRFFSNNPAFDLGSTNIRRFIGQSTTNLTGITDRGGLTNRLEAMQRINHVAPSYNEMRVLLSNGFDSAAGIARLSKQAFINQYSPQLGARAAVIFDNASQVAATAANLFADLQDRFSGAGTVVLPNVTPADAGIPDWATLFGPVDFCECRHCRSVLSPAAYLVDALHFLRDRRGIDPAHPGRSALDVLFSRRPDIGDIELTCENTNTLVRYVDLMIEALNPAAGPTPEDRLLALFTLLSNQTYPWLLPFNQAAEQTRAYLDLAGVHRYDLMKTFQGLMTLSGDEQPVTVPDPEEIAITTEYLGMTSLERKVITGTATQPTWVLWGYSASSGWLDATDGVQHVRNLLDRSGLSHAELVELLDTHYINPNPSARIDIKPDSSCNIDGMTLTPFDEPALGRIVRFVRLWRKLGWTMHEVDLAITAVGAGNIDETFITKLADVRRVRAVLNLKVDTVLALWSLIDTEGEDSLYNRLFLNKRVSDPVDAAFQLNTQGSQLATPGVLNDHIPAILAALRVSTADLDLIRTETGLTDPLAPGPPIVMDMANLSTLYRYAVLSRGLSRLSISDLIALKTLSGSDPFQEPASTKEFIEIFEKVRASGFKIAELKYLLRGESDAASPVAPKDDSIALVLDEIRKGLQKIAGETAEASDPTGEILARKLAALEFDNAVVDKVLGLFNGTDVQRTDFASSTLAAELDAKVVNKPRGTLTYEGITGELRFVGVMTDDEKNAFLGLKTHFADGSTEQLKYIDSINNLYSAAQAGSYSTPLNVEPAGLPQSLQRGEISYDASKKLLKLAGAMTQAESANLKLPPADPDYGFALDRLFAAQNAAIFSERLDPLLLESIPVSSSPGDPGIPSELNGRISYDPQAAQGQLSFVGVMTRRERETLRSLFVNTETAIATLFNSPRDFITARLKYFVTPSAVVSFEGPAPAFPVDLQMKIAYDPVSKELRFTGEMTPADKSTLLLLSSSLANPILAAVYETSINALSEALEASTNDPNNLFLNSADVGQLFDLVSPAHQKFEFVLLRVNAYLRRTSSESLIKQKLGEALKLDGQTTEQLLTRRLMSPTHTLKTSIHEFLDGDFIGSTGKITNAASFRNQFDAFILLHKVGLVASRFKITRTQLDWLFDYAPEVGWLDLNSLALASSAAPASLDGWSRLADLFALRNRLRNGEETLSTVFALSREPSPPVSTDDLLVKLSEMTGWDLDDLRFLDSAAGLTLAPPATAINPKLAYTDERALTRLSDCFAMMRRLGVDARQCRQWTRVDIGVSPDDALRDARAAKQAAKARFDDEAWAEADQPLNESLSEKLRAALVSYMVVHPDSSKNQTWKDSIGLYDYFLIDPEMSPCMLTSRIKQAIGSVQLFVQRCLMNLETGVKASAENDTRWRDWKWMKSYRVWEANRKVFLYPENWVEPELRDDKSPFFKDLENELLQNDITTETAETAFVNYLDKLHAVARLEIVGMVHQLDKDEAGNKVLDAWHVFGRTFNTPHVYYYRRWIDQSYWTAWEKVDLDIQGEHVFPVIWNRRLYLFWALFTEASEGKQPDEVPAAGDSVKKDLKFWKIQLAWSANENGKWLAKSVSKDQLDSSKRTEAIVISSQTRFSLSAVLNQGRLIVTCSWGAGDFNTVELGTFEFDGCDGAPQVRQSVSPAQDLRIPFRTGLEYMKLIESAVIELNLNRSSSPDEPLYLLDDTFQSRQVLQKTPGVLPNTSDTFRLLFTHEDPSAGAQDALFFEDAARTFFVTSRRIARTKQGLNAGSAVSTGAIDNTVNSYYVTSGLSSGVGSLSLASAGLQAAKTALPSSVAAGLPGSSTGGIVNAGGLVNIDPTGIPPSVLPAPSGTRTYLFRTFYHPYVCLFLIQINSKGVEGLLRRFVQTAPNSLIVPGPAQAFDFNSVYAPVNDRFYLARMVDSPFPQEDVDFENGGAYSLYNWELFFHAPLRIADALRKNQRFEDAQKWFHYIFNPTSTDDREKPSDTSSPVGDPKTRRYWQTKPFFQRAASDYDKQRIDRLLTDPDFAANLQSQINRWLANPFNPHAIARLRGVAYQKTVVMKYLDNLIEWGDQLFSRDTIESINEATQLYILAAELLGPRPREINPRNEPVVETYNTLKLRLDAFSNALENLAPSPSIGSGASGAVPPIPLQAFCIPKNDKLLAYWDTVAERLFKIRHCQNIEGVVRQLALFEPPIDPALLVKAAAAGVDIGSALSDINAPLPHYRFNVILQKATELCGEVKALGGALLSALEKRDAEDLGLLRSSHEISLLSAALRVKQAQVDESRQTLEGLKKSREITQIKRDHYRDLEFMNTAEKAHLILVAAGAVVQAIGQVIQMTAGAVEVVPDVYAGGAGAFGSPLAFAHIAGGAKSGGALQAVAKGLEIGASLINTAASMSATLGGYQRRQEDWTLQVSMANKELEQIDTQIAAGEIRLAITNVEVANHQLQIENSKAADEFMHDKFTNRELYDWMAGQISAIYFQSYRLAYDVARRAERAFRFELGLNDLSFIQFGYWDSLKKGLLAGERLSHDLKRMEIAYLDQNKREYELTKHISLVLLDPVALIKLKETGRCFVNLDESLFDMDYPGHYMRRIKSAALTIPCVTGPYTSINCTLTLLKNSVRTKATAAGEYSRDESDPASPDSRFRDSVGAIQSIATSNGQNDTGLFELNFRDERYLPFEGAGAISTWRIELPRESNRFDFNTISDVIIHMKYTAREGGEALKKVALDSVRQTASEPGARARLFSARHEFPGEWNRLLHPGASDPQVLKLNLTTDKFPFLPPGRTIQIDSLELFLGLKGPAVNFSGALAVKVERAGSPISFLELTSLPAIVGVLHGGFDLNQEVLPIELVVTIGVEASGQTTIPVELQPSSQQGSTVQQRLNADAIEDVGVVCHFSVV